jgi:esterase/lipase
MFVTHMYPLRTRFAKDIVTEFFPPYLGRRSAPRNVKALILCGGMPGFPGNKRVFMEFLSRKGYWVFNPRYRGSWESGGKFLRVSPEQDVRDVMDGVSRGFSDLRSKKRYRVRDAEITLIGGSFGGPAVLLLSRDKQVKKVVAISPVADWRAPSREEPIETFYDVVRAEFGEAYRMARGDWDKLRGGMFYNPATRVKEIDGSKVLIFHAKDDPVVPFGSVKRLAEATGARLVLRARGNHLSMSELMTPKFWNITKKFLVARSALMH